MALIGTMLTCRATTPWKAKTFTINQTKLHYYEAGDSKAPYRDPGNLPPFDRNDWAAAVSTCLKDVASVHVECLASDRWALKPSPHPPRSQQGKSRGATPPPCRLNLPLCHLHDPVSPQADCGSGGTTVWTRVK